MVLDLIAIEEEERSQLFKMLSGPVPAAIRDTDAFGWLLTGKLIGIIFTGIERINAEHAQRIVEKKIRDRLSADLPLMLYRKIGISVLVFPEEHGGKKINEQGERFSPLFYPEIFHKSIAQRIADGAKRCMDIVGSLVALILFSPFFIVIPVLIKITSPGPVLFRQERVGQFGKSFKFLKFRSMQVDSDDLIHRNFIKDFIANKIDGNSGPTAGEPVFKIRHDPRLTPIGNFLRKSSIDELPQFINVLRGEMSLVGPRPPIPYEVTDYNEWHLYRILAIKPGITGLWQVQGRSLTTFDGMVRLDLQYIRTWSLWLDIKLLLATPFAVIRGKGAY
jgi:exopolysaccharide biosynthesis polyprenyl glycosylphosphotransferase